MSSGSLPGPPVTVWPLRGMPDVVPGADLATAIHAATAASGAELRDGDILVVSSKIVSKAQGRLIAADSREGAIAGESVRLVARRRTPRGITSIVRSRSGPVLAAAGVDASNVTPGTVLLLPSDPDAAARELRGALERLTGVRLGVVVSDTLGRPWREGQADAAIGASGVLTLDDLRGRRDAAGTLLEATVRAIGDELAAAADLVKGKVDGVPVALVRGLGSFVQPVEGGGAALLRPDDQDWFRTGHEEAVRAALGIGPDDAAPAAVPAPPLGVRAWECVALACAGPRGAALAAVVSVHVGRPQPGSVSVRLSADVAAGPALGALAERVRVAAWAADLVADEVEPAAAPGPAGGGGADRLVTVVIGLREASASAGCDLGP